MYGDLTSIIKERSTPDNPLPFETYFTENADHYNSTFGMKYFGLKIPDTVEKLQERYISFEKVDTTEKEPN